MVTHLRPLVLPFLLAAIVSGSAQAAAARGAAYTLDPAGSWMKFAFTQAKAREPGQVPQVRCRAALRGYGAWPPSKLDVTIKVDSLDTGDEERDEAMRGADLFNVAKFPEAKFHADEIQSRLGRPLRGGRQAHHARRVAKSSWCRFSVPHGQRESGPRHT